MRRSPPTFFAISFLLVGVLFLFFWWDSGRGSGREGGALPAQPLSPSRVGRGGQGEGRGTKDSSSFRADSLHAPASGSGRSRPASGDAGPGIGRRGPRPENAILFPDGTWLPPLNGVEKPPPFPGFPPGRPYAPVVSIYTDPASGLSWFVHSDGSRSTVQMVRREEGGRVWREAGWVVGTPRPTKRLRGIGKEGSPGKPGSPAKKK